MITLGNNNFSLNTPEETFPTPSLSKIQNVLKLFVLRPVEKALATELELDLGALQLGQILVKNAKMYISKK